MTKENPISRFKPRTLLTLIVIYIAVGFDLQWLWGVLFLIWLIPGLLTGYTHLVEPISRDENPVWYWLITGTWLWMAAYLLLESLFNILPHTK